MQARSLAIRDSLPDSATNVAAVPNAPALVMGPGPDLVCPTREEFSRIRRTPDQDPFRNKLKAKT